jgi:hypothetical protein
LGAAPHDVLINHLQSDDFLDFERFPETLLVINSARKIDGASPGQPNLETIADLTVFKRSNAKNCLRDVLPAA